jgi:hypothetical protein
MNELLEELSADPETGITIHPPTKPLPPTAPGPPAAALASAVAVVGVVRVSGLCLADDIALLSRNESGLRRSLAIAESFCRRRRFIVNHPKSAVVVYSRSPSIVTPQPPRAPWMLQGAAIAEQKQYRYLGVESQGNGSWQAFSDKRCARARGTIAQLFHAGVRQRGLRFATGNRLMRGILLPTIGYAAEVIPFTTSQLNEQAVVQSTALRQLLGADRTCSNLMTRCESGFVPLRVQNDRAVIRFLHHLRTPINSFNRSYGILTLAQRMFVVRFAQYQHAAARAAPAVRARGVVVGGVVGGWCALAYATLQRYGLADTQWSCAPVSIRAAQWMERVVAPRMDRVVMEEWRRELINAAHYGSVSAVYYLGGINPYRSIGLF